MGIKRVVDMDFWTDDMVLEEFSPEDKLFFLYLLTNPHSSMLGIYKINPKQMAFEIGYSIEAIKVLLDRFEKQYGVIKYSMETREIAVRNYLRYGIVAGGRPVFDRLSSCMKEVRDKSLLYFILESVEKHPPDNATVIKFTSTLKDYLNSIYEDGNGNEDGNGDGDGESYHDSGNDSCDESGKSGEERPTQPPPVPYEAIKKLYNEICKSYPRCTVLSEARKKAIRARFKSGYTLEQFKTVFTKAEASEFMKGKNDRNWTATFDWLIKDGNMVKVLDGNYDNERGANTNGRNPGNTGPGHRVGNYI